jgi:hypothetical protein
MFKSVFSRIAIVCTLALVGTALNANPSAPIQIGFEDDQIVILRAGTSVSLELAQEVEVSSVYTGNTLDFMVRSNVTVNGVVVIVAGSIAEGRVAKVEKSCDGKCYAITIIVSNVQAVDGQRVNLRSTPHIMKSTCCDGPGVLSIGTAMSSTVLNDIKIEA